MNTYEFRRNGEERKRGDRRITGFQPVFRSPLQKVTA